MPQPILSHSAGGVCHGAPGPGGYSPGEAERPLGARDAVNPTANLTPRDYTVFLPFDEDQRVGTTAVKVDVPRDAEYPVTVFATPLFEPSKIPMPLVPETVIMANEKPASPGYR